MKPDFLILAALLLMYFEHLKSWTGKWLDFDSFYSIGLLVLVFVFFFFKDNWKELAKIPHKPLKIGYPVILIALVLYFVGTKADIVYFSSFSLPLLIAGIVISLYGKDLFLKILPVLLFFTIALPVLPVFRITMPFQLMLSQITAHFLNFIGLNASYSGSLIILENQLIDVEAGCSGVTSLYSLFVATFMYIYYKNIKFINKVFLIIGSIILSLIGNFVRITITSFYILYNGGGQSYEKYHENLGIIIFIILLGIVFIATSILEGPEDAEQS